MAFTDLSNTPLDAAWTNWLDYMRRAMDFNRAANHGFSYIEPMTKLQKDLTDVVIAAGGQFPDYRSAMDDMIEAAKKEIDSDHEFLHAQVLLAAWGAFEAYVEDVCVAMLCQERGLLETSAFAKVKITPPLLLADETQQAETIFFEAVKHLASDLKNGVGKFESQLTLVGLEGRGDFTDELRNLIFHAGHTRNVWAHRAGKADARFIKNCPDLGANLGDVIKISTDEIQKYMSAIATYGWLIMCRYRFRRKLEPPLWLLRNTHAGMTQPYFDAWKSVTDQNRPLLDTALFSDS